MICVSVRAIRGEHFDTLSLLAAKVIGTDVDRFFGWPGRKSEKRRKVGRRAAFVVGVLLSWSACFRAEHGARQFICCRTLQYFPSFLFIAPRLLLHAPAARMVRNATEHDVTGTGTMGASSGSKATSRRPCPRAPRRLRGRGVSALFSTIRTTRWRSRSRGKKIRDSFKGLF